MNYRLETILPSVNYTTVQTASNTWRVPIQRYAKSLVLRNTFGETWKEPGGLKSNHYMAAECGGLGAKCRVFTEDPFGTSCTELDLTGYSLEKTVESLLNRAEGTRQDAEEALSFYNRLITAPESALGDMRARWLGNGTIGAEGSAVHKADAVDPGVAVAQGSACGAGGDDKDCDDSALASWLRDECRPANTDDNRAGLCEDLTFQWLCEVDALGRKNGATLFLQSGSLLTVVRDGGIPADDDDVDVGVVQGSSERALYRDLLRVGYIIEPSAPEPSIFAAGKYLRVNTSAADSLSLRYGSVERLEECRQAYGPLSKVEFWPYQVVNQQGKPVEGAELQRQEGVAIACTYGVPNTDYDPCL